MDSNWTATVSRFSEMRSAVSDVLKASDLAMAIPPSSLIALSCRSSMVSVAVARRSWPRAAAVKLPTSVRAKLISVMDFLSRTGIPTPSAKAEAMRVAVARG